MGGFWISSSLATLLVGCVLWKSALFSSSKNLKKKLFCGLTNRVRLYDVVVKSVVILTL